MNKYSELNKKISIMIKRHFKNLILAFIAFLLNASVSAQVFSYAYDDAGNRVQRNVIVFKSSQPADTLTESLGEINALVMPNPTVNDLTVNLTGNITENTNSSIILFDISGKQLQSVSNVNSVNFPMQDYSNGTYYLKIQVGTKRKEIKIIKQ